MSQKPNAVIYHRADFDGLFCREIARKFLGDTADYIGWDYNDDKLPFPEAAVVYVLDLSPECFDEVTVPQSQHLVWIDHHKSALEKWPDSIAGYRIDGVAACRLAWQWFSRERRFDLVAPGKEQFVDRQVTEPLAVRLAGEYDIWDKRDPDAELFQHGLRSQELTDITWKYLLGDDRDPGELCVEDLLEGGRVLQFQRTTENASIIQELGFTLDWEGLKFLACNAARYNSLLFTAGLTPEHDACFGFKWTGRDWSVSLYHAPGQEHHDLSLIAKKHGGGGHRGACGFRTNQLPFSTHTGRRDDEMLAAALYEVYCAHVGGKAFNGDPLPDWQTFRADENKFKQSQAWVATARAAYSVLIETTIAT